MNSKDELREDKIRDWVDGCKEEDKEEEEYEECFIKFLLK